MTGIGQDPRVRAYLDAVCSKVRAKERHAEIREELLGHLEELAEELRAEGMEEPEAAREALRRMGDAERVGAGLHLVHRPKPDLWLAAMAVLLLLAGLAYVYGLQQRWPYESTLLQKQLLHGAAGLVVLTACYYAPLQSLRRWSWPIFGAGAALLAAAPRLGVQVNGHRGYYNLGPLIVESAGPAILFMLIGAAGILSRLETGKAGQTSLWRDAVDKAALLGMLPAFLFLYSNDLSRLPLYAAGLGVIVLLNRRWRLAAVGAAMVPVIVLAAMVFKEPYFYYAWERLTGTGMAKGSSEYQLAIALDAVRSAGWLGQGFHAGPDSTVPVSSEFLFPFLVYSLGWAFGLLLGTLLLLFSGRCLAQALRVQDCHARALAAALAAVFGVQTIWSLLLTFGIVPVIGYSLPLLGWGSPLLGEMAMLGLLLGLIRQRDRKPAAFSSAAG
ncbi:FtsW/RodA/SpoVE family cell cycle protein [Paenibacillus sp. B01]|uniref:FtsW/RodA/SpoVE family cell cycle protein n=1 Tax=Paenibacillus sp. B01 TaxID=2660554 RepID=UPI0018917373|nr:FtsW/RodA/SpoVE family cell cycle protein [Paenibacillus sp. B01]